MRSQTNKKSQVIKARIFAGNINCSNTLLIGRCMSCSFLLTLVNILIQTQCMMEDSRYKRQKTKLRDRTKIASLRDEVETLKQQIIALTAKTEKETDPFIGEEKPKSEHFYNYIEVSFIENICSFSFLSFFYS